MSPDPSGTWTGRETCPGDKTDRRRVVWLINDFDRGGAQQGLVTLARNGAFAGVALTIVPVVRGSGAFVKDLEGPDIRVLALDDAERMKVIHLVSGAWRLWRLLGAVRPSALILSLPQANIIGRIVGRLRDVPVIASFEHNTHLAKPVYELAYRWTSPLVDWTLADCDATADEATRRLYVRRATRRTILPLASFSIEPPTSEPEAARTGPFRIVNAGRLTAVKNQTALIHAVRLLRDRGHDVSLRLYGEGRERQRYEALVQKLALQDRVHFMGHVTGWWTQGADLFVLSSRHEGLCIALLEAMAAGIPAAAPLVGGVRDYGADGAVDILEDVLPETIASAIEGLMAAPERRLEFSRRGRAVVVERFGDEAIGARYKAFAAELRALPCR
ncbi:glycosyltransferase [Brevundimonas sp.]|uniref:glycosyltransferase n=1 Tax=Brevundimonas sp. TaxID=1871086 RepID=UPI0026076557|nr:glycosyltransferase [Brevundimonas sp.]